jgi:hypothetical protein
MTYLDQPAFNEIDIKRVWAEISGVRDEVRRVRVEADRMNLQMEELRALLTRVHNLLDN